MAVRVQVPPSAPYRRGTMALSCCSPFNFCLSHPVKSVFSVSFWYQSVRISAAPRPKLAQLYEDQQAIFLQLITNAKNVNKVVSLKH